MKVNFKVAMSVYGDIQKDEKGEEVYLNKTLANMLGSNPHKDTGINYMDAVTWAIAINKGEDIDLEKSEQEAVKKFIENSDFSAFAKQNLIECFKSKPEAKTNGKEAKQSQPKD